MSETFIISRET